MGRVTAMHAMVYAANATSGNVLKDTFITALKSQFGLAKDDQVDGEHWTLMQDWLHANVSGAADTADEMMAEATTLYALTGELPGALGVWGKTVLSNFNRDPKLLEQERLR
jgi:hypothetical protein